MRIVAAPAGDDVRISSVVLVDVDDLADAAFTSAIRADLWLLAGVPVEVAVTRLTAAAGRSEARPVAVLSKLATSPELEAAARRAGAALSPSTRRPGGESLLGTVRGVTARAMMVSLTAYLSHLGDVWAAAEQLRVHANTLRYRVRRAEEVLTVDLSDPSARLLVELQLAMLTPAPAILTLAADSKKPRT